MVAILFQPLRRTVQRQIDRRFYRSRVDADRTVSQFLDRTREQVDLERLVGEMRLAASGAVQPSSARVWLRAGGHARATGGMG